MQYPSNGNILSKLTRMSIDGINKHFEFIPHPKVFNCIKKYKRVDREDGFEKLIASIIPH